MHNRSQKSRSSRPELAWLAVCAVLTLIAGCQNNSERDLIARERRAQEDQIYSMQDYIHQYQQLVCQYRNENASLRRQLSDGDTNGPDRLEPQPIPSSRSAAPAAKPTPKFETPDPPGVKQTSPPPEQTELPEIPPLKQSSANDGDSQSPVRQATYEEPVADTKPQQTSADGAVASATVELTQSAANNPGQYILVSGEVVENESGGGPRMAIDVTPFDESGRVQLFTGSVSLMLLSPGADGKKQNVGRWDFKPEDVQDSIDPKANEPTMRFHVEVPAETPIGRSTELWVRLIPVEGFKQLAHASVDLTHAGVFSSRTDNIWRSEEAVLAASYEEPAESAAPATESIEPSGTLVEGAWATAMPNRPANLAQDLASPTQGWRTSSQPIPPVLANSTKNSSTRRFDKLRDEVKASRSLEESTAKTASATAQEEPSRRPSWAPERSGEAARRTAKRPNWSATR